MNNILKIFVAVSEAESISIGALEKAIGASKGVLSRPISKGTDVQSKWLSSLIKKFPAYPYGKWVAGEFSTSETEMVKEPSNDYKTKKQPAKEIADLSYAMNRRLDDLEDLIYLAINKIDRSKSVEELKKELKKLQEDKVEK